MALKRFITPFCGSDLQLLAFKFMEVKVHLNDHVLVELVIHSFISYLEVKKSYWVFRTNLDKIED